MSVASIIHTKQHSVQVQSFLNLIQSTDEAVQYAIYIILQQKYSKQEENLTEKATPFLQLRGILNSNNTVTDEELLNDYLKEKYNI